MYPAIKVVLAVLAIYFAYLAIIRIWSKLRPAPCPFRVKGILENPFRKHLLGPVKTLEWVGIGRNMKALELGSGTGFLTVEAARRVGEAGRLCCVDIQPQMLIETRKRIEKHEVKNVNLAVADALALPFASDSFDMAFLVTVLGEISRPDMALDEMRRVIRPGGILSVFEILFDPHYCLAGTVKAMAKKAGFEVTGKSGNFFFYALNLRKV